MSASFQRAAVKACKVGARLTRHRVVLSGVNMPYSSAAMVSSADAQARIQMLLQAFVMQSAVIAESQAAPIDGYAARDFELRRQAGTLEEKEVLEEDLYARMDREWRRQAEMKFSENTADNKFDCVYDGLDARKNDVEEDYYDKLERELTSQACGY